MAHRLCNRLGRHLSCRQSFPRISAASSAKQDIFLHDLKRQELASHIVPARLLTKSRPFSSLTSGQSKRLFSSFNGNSGSFLANPSYQVYGEEIAFTVKCIMPTFRVVGKRTVVMDKANAGRLLLEFTPRMANDNRFAWDSSIKFALSAEEVGTLVAHLTHGQPLELARQTAQGGGNQQYGFHDNKGVGSLQKVLRVMPENGGMAVTMSIDYEVDGRKGQDPPNPQEAKGPLEIRLMMGESQVLKSIMEYSIPRLVGWAQMIDRPAKELVSEMNNNNNNNNNKFQASPHSYNNNADGANYSVPF